MKTLTAVAEEITALHDQFARREYDIELIKNGGSVYYALDNDVTTTITAPWLDSGTHIFGPLFTDIPEAHQAFATIFAEYVFSKGAHNPFFIIPPANNELEGQWNSVLLQAADILESIDRHFSGLLKESHILLSASPNVGDSAIFDAIDQAVQIVYGGKSPATELRRIARLSEAGSLRRIDAHLELDGRPIGQIPESTAQDFRLKESAWYSRLTAKRPKHQSSNEVDAAVLASIEIINRDYLQRGVQRRLCLITGDSHLFSAASEVILESGRDFSNGYLRRPTAFLADKEFFERAESNDSSRASFATDALVAKTLVSSVANWIKEIALIGLYKTINHDRQRSSHLLTAIGEARSSWSRYLKSTSALFSISPNEINAIAHTHAQAAKYLHLPSVRSTFESLRQQVQLIGEESRLRFGVAGALSRFWSIDSAVSHQVERLTPVVRFDSLKFAEGVATEISLHRGVQIAELQKTKKWLIDLQKEDSSQYTTMIVFALAFATLGEWRTALSVAGVAYSIARTQRSINGDSRIKGDEAAYLCAVFSRITSQTLSELNQVSDWIAESDRLCREQPQRSEIAKGSDTDFRLPAEQLAMRLTRRMFLHYLPSENDFPMAQALGRSIESFGTLFDAHRDEFVEIRGLPDTARKRYVYLQLLVNALQCAILAPELIDLNVLANQEVREATLNEIDYILSNTKSESPLIPFYHLRSSFSDFVFMIAARTFFASELGEDNYFLIGEKTLAVSENGGIFPYDNLRRLDFLKRAKLARP